MLGRRAVTGVENGTAGRHRTTPAGPRNRLRVIVRAAGWTSVLLLLLTAASLGVVGLVCLFPIVVELCGVAIPAMRQERTAPERWAATWRGLRARPWLLSIFWVVVGGGLPLLGAAIANEVAPYTVTRATLTNGTKTVLVQGMVHVGAPGFYQAVEQEVAARQAEGYVVFVEGSSPPSPAVSAQYAALVGPGNVNDRHALLAQALGLDTQVAHPALLCASEPGELQAGTLCADVSGDALVQAYERQVGPLRPAATTGATTPTDTTADFVTFVRDRPPPFRAVLAYLMRALTNWELRQDQDARSTQASSTAWDQIVGKRT